MRQTLSILFLIRLVRFVGFSFFEEIISVIKVERLFEKVVLPERGRPEIMRRGIFGEIFFCKFDLRL